jgi:hypothetical protein
VDWLILHFKKQLSLFLPVPDTFSPPFLRLLSWLIFAKHCVFSVRALEGVCQSQDLPTYALFPQSFSFGFCRLTDLMPPVLRIDLLTFGFIFFFFWLWATSMSTFHLPKFCWDLLLEYYSLFDFVTLKFIRCYFSGVSGGSEVNTCLKKPVYEDYSCFILISVLQMQCEFKKM